MTNFTPTATEVGSRINGIEYYISHIFGKHLLTRVAYDVVSGTFTIVIHTLGASPHIRITVPSVQDATEMYASIKHELRTKYPEYFI